MKPYIKQQYIRQRVREMLFLSVAYSASCGGVGTLTGTGPNLVLKGMVRYRVSHNIGSTLFFCYYLGLWSMYRGTSDHFSTALEICYMIATRILKIDLEIA